MIKIGFVLNPISGIGGALAMKGSDHLKQAQILDHRGYSRARSKIFIDTLCDFGSQLTDQIQWVTPEGQMGGGFLEEFGFDYLSSGMAVSRSSGRDTTDAVVFFQSVNCDLIVFVGGDGTARDVLEGINSNTPVIGVPAGVKMHSGVFSVTPDAAARIIESLVSGEIVNLDDGEVRDYVEGIGVQTKRYGEMLVPQSGRFIQHTKIGGKENEELIAQEIAAEVKDHLAENTLLLGPGSTCKLIKETLGLSASQTTLLGFDLYSPGKPWVLDLTSLQIKEQAGRIERVIVSFTRGQGFLFGRGNQQLDGDLLSTFVWPDQYLLVGTRTKLLSLSGRPLLVDTGDSNLNASFRGLTEIATGYEDRVVHLVDFEQGS